MQSRRRILLSMAICLGTLPVAAQNVPGSGWSSLGVLPSRGYDFLILKTPSRYILYYTMHGTASLFEQATDPTARAFSADLKTWTVDPSDVCAASGDLCQFRSRPAILTLPDGRYRMFFHELDKMYSATSSDGLTWTRDPGVRLTQDTTSIYERGPFAGALASFVTLPDGSVRMYYIGGVVPGSAGTPAYYNNDFKALDGTILKPSGMILSALSKDNGLTWTREPGVRINPLVQGPVNNVTYHDGVTRTEIDATDVSAVAVKENGRTVYRLYAPSWWDGTVSYVSTDGLSFVLEGQVPADRGDAKALVLPDGRVWMITNQYPDAIDDTIVYGPQTFFLNATRADVDLLPLGTQFPPPGTPPFLKRNSFQSALIGVTGTSSGPVTFEAVAGPAMNCGEPCPFHPEYYSFAPFGKSAPFTTVVSDVGPDNYVSDRLIVHARSGGATAVGAISCMDQSLDSPSASVFCRTAMPELPMNQMNFAFAPGAAPSSQISNILSPGGSGYPFTVSSSVPWATATPAAGVAPAPITVKVDPAGLGAGVSTGVITISAEGTTETIALTATVAAGPVITSVRNAASSEATIAPNSFVTIYGSGFAVAPLSWTPTAALPVSLGGARVKINGKDAFVSYASPNQLNVLAPQDTASGVVKVEVTTAAGTATATATMAPVAPSWFAYTVGKSTWLAALFGNTATLVAPAGSLGVASRSAQAGDILQLYANGLGATSPAAPPGVVLDTAYPLDDLSRVRVSIGRAPAVVQFAGLVAAGLYQINVQVPEGIKPGDAQVLMFVDGQPTQGGVTLNVQ